MASLRLPLVTLRWAVIGLVAGAVLALAASTLAGYRTYTVMSGSMEPAIMTGDIVVNRPIRPTDIAPGDVITFKDPSRPRLLTHRVISRALKQGRMAVVTRGDANGASEHWSVPASGTLGRVTVDVPHAGYALVWLRRPLHLILLVLLPALALAVFELRSIWREPDATDAT